MGTSRIASIDARPQPVEFDTAKTAVIVVDMQNDFGSPLGMFGRAGIDLTGIRGTIAPTARVLAAARRAGLMVVYLKMAFRPDLSDTGAPNKPNWLKHERMHAGQAVTAPDGTPSRILIRDTWNTEIIDELTPAPNDVVVYKHRFSGFFETDLDAILRSDGIENLIFTGCTTSVCVESTLKDAMFRDYHCLLLEDCTAEAIGAGSARTNHEATVLVIELLVGSVSNAEECCRALNASANSDLAHSS
jgi:ureidoacrylate peracid hydrolase